MEMSQDDIEMVSDEEQINAESADEGELRSLYENIMLLLTESAVHTENICCDVMPHGPVMPYGPNEVRSVRHDVTTNIFRMDQTQG